LTSLPKVVKQKRNEDEIHNIDEIEGWLRDGEL